MYFNSHPHEEDDATMNRQFSVFDISTHILTKRMTCIYPGEHYGDDYFNSHPHEEDDCASGSTVFDVYISTHILTKRMTLAPLSHKIDHKISTHILTKRMTRGFGSLRRSFTFQLTSSRRG